MRAVREISRPLRVHAIHTRRQTKRLGMQLRFASTGQTKEEGRDEIPQSECSYHALCKKFILFLSFSESATGYDFMLPRICKKAVNRSVGMFIWPSMYSALLSVGYVLQFPQSHVAIQIDESRGLSPRSCPRSGRSLTHIQVTKLGLNKLKENPSLASSHHTNMISHL